MKKLITICAGLGLALTSYAMASTELPKTIRPVQPIHSELVSNKSLVVKRFVLANQSDVAFENLVSEVRRHSSSDKQSQVIYIISHESSAKTLAKNISKRLKELHVKPAIHVEHYKTQNSLYPLYVEIRQIAKRTSQCKVETAEDHMGFDSYHDCALKHNNQVQLKY
ncbi:Rough colony protein B [Actinobacillus equuli subsp. haemolyticus]|uniref:Rough colony protein B n=1 Tax=Actinobacillus equuli TaxID=718 RepID=UPI0024186E29|nr:Rough colony protein B [Actinobacillus equuli]MDG4948513.1 Rough colony protein B [Actinobacillus equuli subsp. haemolyticus]